MSTAIHANPTQILLPGQAAAPEGPIDMTVMYVMHHGFRRDLERFAAAVPATPLDDRPIWAALRARWERMAAVLHHHHMAEDEGVWPVLLDRADASEVAALEAMESEHELLDPALAAVAEGFARMELAESTQAARAQLIVELELVLRLLGDHLSHEEAEAVTIIQRHLSPREWAGIEREHFDRKPAPGPIRFLVPWFLESVPQQDVARIVATVGTPVLVIWRLTRWQFRRGEQRAFRHGGV